MGQLQEKHLVICIVLTAILLILSLVLNRILLRFSKTLGRRNTNHDNLIRWASDSKPSIGGIAFYIVFLISYIAYSIVFSEESQQMGWAEVGVLSAVTLGFIMGLSDDAYNTNPLLKFSVQVLCGVVLIATGTFISIFPYDALNYAFTIFWVVAVMNSINMLDNMDAITTTVSIFIVLTALLTASLSATFTLFSFTLMLGTLAALVGFLFYNWNPAKMFMGDTGSQFLGVFLAAIAIPFFWNNVGLMGTEASSRQIIIVALAFIVPIADTGTVIINRMMRGQSPFVGGKDHTTHHLSYLGFTDKQVAMILATICFGSFLLVFLIVHYLNDWHHGYTIGFLVYILLVTSSLYFTTRMKKARITYQKKLQNNG